MKLIPLTFIALILHSSQSVASEGLIDAALSVCLPLRTAEEWVNRCNSEFPEFSEANLSAFALWKERNSNKFDESHRNCIAELEKILPKENQANVSETLKTGLIKRTNEQWERLPRNALMTYCKNMSEALMEREHFINNFLANSVKRESKK
ncbi:MAG: hypothetical protein PHY62_09150 [Gallionella sp.]|nr:hypothetical protein [Gallionella sp.]